MPGVKISGLRKTYFIEGVAVNAVRDLSFFVEDGSFVIVVGKSGCGKTTLLRLICGLEGVTEGLICFTDNGIPISMKDKKVSIVFQEPRLMPWLTVKQNMAFSLAKERNKEKTKQTVGQYLKILGLESFKDAYPFQISGGMAQRVALGRTLCFNPDIILMDEPFGALDAFTRRKLQREVVEIFQSLHKTIIFVTHDVDEAVLLGQRILVMERGRLVLDVTVGLTYPRDPFSREFYKKREEILKTILKGD